MIHSKNIGNKILQARKNLGLSQSELASKIAISPQAVGKWERGESLPDITMLMRLSEFLQVDLNYFSETTTAKSTMHDSTTKQKSISDPLNDTISGGKENPSWNMSNGNWANADFSGLQQIKDEFSSSNVVACQFKNANLAKLEMAKNNLERCDFSYSTWEESKIKSSNLLKSTFASCNFEKAHFYKNNIEKCDFNNSNFTKTVLAECNLDEVNFDQVCLHSTQFIQSNISKITFTGIIENGYFERCSFYQVVFKDAVIKNTFFKYNERLNKVTFENCRVDNITLAFLKNNKANLDGISILHSDPPIFQS